MTDSSTAKVLPFHRHEPAIALTASAKVESIVCPCKVCGKVMEFPVESEEIA